MLNSVERSRKQQDAISSYLNYNCYALKANDLFAEKSRKNILVLRNVFRLKRINDGGYGPVM